ncbi:hypothetical protein ACFX15_026468 [Malus domestica]
MSSSLVRMKHDKQEVKVPAIPTPPTFHLLYYLGQWILVLLILPCSAFAACDRLDRDTLLSLPFNTPLNWSASTDYCLWDGVNCDPVEHSCVVRHSLPKRGLSGVVSSSIMNLTNLRILELYSNNFFGQIPGDIGNLFRLENLLLHINNFTGALPPSLTNCTNLSTLNLRLVDIATVKHREIEIPGEKLPVESENGGYGNGHLVADAAATAEVEIWVECRPARWVRSQSRALGPRIVLNIGAMRRFSEARLHPANSSNPSSKFI